MTKGNCVLKQRFPCTKDTRYIQSIVAEKHQLYYKPRRYLINDDTITLNIYGEPGTNPEGTDGVTSVPATRQFTSASADFVTDGVLPGDLLEIYDPPCDTDDDNERYIIDQVVDANTLLVTTNWPEGSLTGLNWRVHLLPERYREFEHLVPFLLKLNPHEKLLDKWGIDDKRDAAVEFSIELCNQLGLTPKIGDRFVHEYGGASIHYELMNLFTTDSVGDSGDPFHYVGFAMKTTNQLPQS